MTRFLIVCCRIFLKYILSKFLTILSTILYFVVQNWSFVKKNHVFVTIFSIISKRSTTFSIKFIIVFNCSILFLIFYSISNDLLNIIYIIALQLRRYRRDNLIIFMIINISSYKFWHNKIYYNWSIINQSTRRRFVVLKFVI